MSDPEDEVKRKKADPPPTLMVSRKRFLHFLEKKASYFKADFHFYHKKLKILQVHTVFEKYFKKSEKMIKKQKKCFFV